MYASVNAVKLWLPLGLGLHVMMYMCDMFLAEGDVK